jgi:hypothetical protein
MKKKISVPAGVQQQRDKLTAHQKSFSVYVVILFVCFLLLPLVKINYLDSTQVDTFKLFNAYMTKTTVIVVIVLAYLIAYNLSTRRRHGLQKIFGISTSTYLTNVGGLLIILLSLFSIGDTVTLFKQTFSSRVGTTNGFMIIGVLIIIGIVRNIMLARIEHKKASFGKEVTVKKETDTSGHEPGFEQAQKDVEGLFENSDEAMKL